MIRKLPAYKLLNHQKNDTIRISNIIKRLQEKNELIDAKPEIITGLLRAITILYFHQDEIGKEIYPDIIDLLADIIAEGLTK